MKDEVIEIAKKLKKNYLDDIGYQNDISIFLCGGSGEREMEIRKSVGEKITSKTSKYNYAVYYPEDMFIELILGYQKHDLLTLENMLADSVTAVAILLHSPGTFTELGAFANHERLRNKLIVVVDKKYEKAKSFINYGPIRFLKKKTDSKILFVNLKENNTKEIAAKISNEAREISKNYSPLKDLANPIFAYNFYLALVYVFEPITKDDIIKICNLLNDHNEEIITNAANTVLNSLINERNILLDSGLLSVTSKGIKELIYQNQTKKKSKIISSLLTELRLDSLNLIYRKNKKRKVWGEVR